MLRRATGAPPRLWGAAIVGFGAYRQTYASGREVDWPVIGFSPRKSEHVLYLLSGTRRVAPQLARLGKHRTGKACLYLRSLAEVNLPVLEDIVRRSVAAMATRRVDRPAAARKPLAVGP
jgi:predicted GIY-YIG superfamily endonuclease